MSPALMTGGTLIAIVPASVAEHYSVLFFSMWRSEPVFHCYTWEPRSGDRNADFTRCGRVVYDEDGRSYVTSIPTRHALKFGRPCQICFGSVEAA